MSDSSVNNRRSPNGSVGNVERQLLELLFEANSESTTRNQANGLSAALAERAIQWGVAPALLQRLSQRDDALPVEVGKCVESFVRMTRVRTLRLASRGAIALGALNRAGVNAVCFKGFACYARTGLLPFRSMGDVDFLVTPDELDRAIVILEDVGFRLDIPGSLEDYQAFIRSAPHFSGNRAVALVDEDGHSIDLHWGFGRMCGPALQPERIVERSVQVERCGQAIRHASRVDNLLLSAHHVLRENFTPSAITKSLLDIADLIRVEDERAEDPVFKEAGMPSVALVACQHILRKASGQEQTTKTGTRPSEILDAADRRQAENLAAVFELQVDAPSVNRDVLHLLHGASLRELLRTAFLHAGRNRRFMKAIGEVPDRNRLRRFLGDLRRVVRRDFSLYRSLARAKRPSRSR
ncbi:MAG: nucleotidyltransferase family protein [Pirellulales bacterium]